MANGEDTVKNLVDILIKTASSSATILERLDQFKDMNNTVTELRASVNEMIRIMEKDPNDTKQTFSELFQIIRDVQSKSSVMESMAKETIPNIRSHLSEIHRTIENLSSDITVAAQEMGCPAEEVMRTMLSGAESLHDEIKTHQSLAENLRNDVNGLRIQLSGAISTPKWIWILLACLSLSVLALAAPDLITTIIKLLN